MACTIVVQWLNHVWLFAAPWTAAHQIPLSFTVSQSFLKFMSLSQWCYLNISFSATPFSFCLQSFLASGSFPMSWLVTSDGQHIELQFQYQSFQRIFRTDFLLDWLDLLVVQGTLKRLPHSFGSFGHSNQSRKRNKRNPDRKRSKTLTVCRWHDILHRKP